jgi:pimeloyl-ACP methyl ester carboxylesterase
VDALVDLTPHALRGKHGERFTPLLTTKLHLPRPCAQLVPRSYLVERLQEGVVGPLTPQWPAWHALAHTTPYDAEIGGQGLPLEYRLSALQTPTLVLQGEVSPAWMQASAQALARALPQGKLAILPGQDHFAMYEAPKLLADKCISFLVNESPVLHSLQE